ncbi:hypothetical protein HWV62_37757 [Athelia sp. TMB]|nr:hypothetical protein HWV62_37757 [Athelia sp. TMB]
MFFILARRQCRSPFEILFMGGDEFSAVVFEQLVAAKAPLVALADTNQIPALYVPKSDTNLSKRMRWVPPTPFTSTDPETHRDHLLITASFGRILPKPFLSLFPQGQRLNVHPSRLPAYRGPAPIQRTIMNDEKSTGVCVIETLPYKMGIDAGPVWGRADCDVLRDSTFESLRDNLARAGGQLLVSVLRDMLKGMAVAQPQSDASGYPHAPFITAEDANVDFQKLSAEEVVRYHRAISHMRPLFTHVRDKAIQILAVTAYNPEFPQTPQPPLEPGSARYDPHTRSILIACSSGVVSVSKVKQQDRNAISAKEWWNGVRSEWKDADGIVRSEREKKPYTVSTSFIPPGVTLSLQILTNFDDFQRPEPRADGMWVHDRAPGTNRSANIPTGPSRSEGGLNSKLVVSGLHYEITPKDLTAIFGQIGTLVREPLIRYDRSGRSSGVAIISFETPAEATRAKKQFDGILAKGQPMSIAYDQGPSRRQGGRAVSAPTSLLNRIEKPPLADRLSKDDTSTRASTSKGPGPIRSKRGGGGARSAPRAPKKPKTAEDLDNELDLFMGDGPKDEDALAAAAEPVSAVEGDVDMA